MDQTNMLLNSERNKVKKSIWLASSTSILIFGDLCKLCVMLGPIIDEKKNTTSESIHYQIVFEWSLSAFIKRDPPGSWWSGIRRGFARHALCLKLSLICLVCACVDLVGATRRISIVGS